MSDDAKEFEKKLQSLLQGTDLNAMQKAIMDLFAGGTTTSDHLNHSTEALLGHLVSFEDVDTGSKIENFNRRTRILQAVVSALLIQHAVDKVSELTEAASKYLAASERHAEAAKEYAGAAKRQADAAAEQAASSKDTEKTTKRLFRATVFLSIATVCVAASPIVVEILKWLLDKLSR